MKIETNCTPRYSKKEIKKIENIHIQDKVSGDFIELKSKYKFKIFHLTIDWIKTNLQENSKHLNNDLNKLYKLYLVKYACNVNRISKNNRHIQPILVSFIDKGKDQNKTKTSNCKKLHHHCLIAARDDTAERLEHLCGLNTIKTMCQALDALYPHNNLKDAYKFKIYNMIASSDMKLITNDEVQTRYPSKSLYKYDEENMLMFNYPVNDKMICS